LRSLPTAAGQHTPVPAWRPARGADELGGSSEVCYIDVSDSEGEGDEEQHGGSEHGGGSSDVEMADADEGSEQPGGGEQDPAPRKGHKRSRSESLRDGQASEATGASSTPAGGQQRRGSRDRPIGHSGGGSLLCWGWSQACTGGNSQIGW
jgi:hypothetical protein